jgi:predicted ATPase/DNA-binding SARP family transcriptional activator
MPENPPRLPTNLRQAAGNGAPISASEADTTVGGTSGLELRLFGPMEVRVGSLPLPHLRSRRGLWLLALLALRGGRDVDRDWVAGTLWPDSDESHARRSLRQSLHDLRIALGPQAWRLTSDEPRSLRLELGGAFVDVLEFDAALERGDPASLESAVELYRGPLLEDCSEEWALEGRRQREQSITRALEALASDAARRQDHGVAAGRLRAALRIDPYREDLLRALMEALAGDGSPAAALVAYREYRALLGRELIGEPAEETAALFRRLRDECRACAKAGTDSLQKSPISQSAAPTTRRSLPIPFTALIGRDEDVRKVVSLAVQARLITLTGTGGVGKTRLAIRVAEELAADYSDGAVFVDLAPLQNPDLLPDVVRAAVGAPEDKELQDPAEVLCVYLSTRRTLLVLDNCEHLGRACGSLAEMLLGRCACLRILATSRQVLGVKGETVWRVSSLAVPKTVSNKPLSAANIRHVSAFQDFAAIRLFAERARAAESSFEISRKNSIAVVKICGRLDGIPLAIELAAARVKGMPVEKIAERLNDRFRILLGRRRSPTDAPIPRHQTLRASIDWSYDLLCEAEQILMRRLAVFVGGWTLEAAEAVCSGGPVHEWEVLDLLTGLVEKSLVVYQPDEDRYRLLETVRQYLLHSWPEEKAAEQTSRRHFEYFLALAEEADTRVTGAIRTDWLDRVEEEHDNLRAALQCTLATPAWNPDAKASGIRLAAALWRFWHVRGFFREGLHWYAAALEDSSCHEPTPWRAKALTAAGSMATILGEYIKARAYLEEGLSVARAIDDKRSAGSLLHNLGMLAQHQGDLESARSFLTGSLLVRREVGDQFGVGSTLHHLAQIATEVGDYKEAVILHEENLSLRRQIGDRWGVAHCLSGLGTVLCLQEEYGQAYSLLQESLAIGYEMGDREGIAVCLHHLGWVALGLHKYAEARSNHLESLKILHELGARASIPEALEALAAVECAKCEEPTNTDFPTDDDRRRGINTVGEGKTAARLFGAAEALREAVGAIISPAVKQDYVRRVGRLREAMDAEAFATAWAEGRAMTLEQAVACALEPPEVDASAAP